MNRFLQLLGILGILVAQTSVAWTQDNEKPIYNAWLELGWQGFTPTRHEKSTGINATFKYQRNRLLGTTQYHDYFDSELAHGGFELFTDANHYHAGNVMIGITNRKCRFGHVSVSSGLGVFWGTMESDIVHEKFTTLGWPVEAAASINIFPFVGINMKLFTNLNSTHSMVGFGMDLQLGKLRNLHWQELIPR